MPYIWAAGLQTAEEAGAGRAPHSDWDKGTKREVREENRRKCTVNARREILMHSCISEMLFVHPEDSLQSLFTLSFLRTATLPSENASKKPQGPRKTPMGRTGRAQLPSGICSNEIVKALLKGHKRGPMVEKHNPPLPSSRPEPATWYRAALRLLKA